MIDRRDVLTGGLAARMTGALPRSEAAAVQREGSVDNRRELENIQDELRLVRLSLDLPTSRELDEVRRQLRAFLKTNQKYPDYLDVGVDVWERAYDWHVRVQQPLRVAVGQDGRLGLVFMMTTLVLRPDWGNDVVGLGYDVRQGG